MLHWCVEFDGAVFVAGLGSRGSTVYRLSSVPRLVASNLAFREPIWGTEGRNFEVVGARQVLNPSVHSKTSLPLAPRPAPRSLSVKLDVAEPRRA